jgi:predicted HAD superfamily Cof-like phosphohydrolase
MLDSNLLMKLVELTHKHFDIKAPTKAIILPEEHLKMRLNFLLEELTELGTACGFFLNTIDKKFIKNQLNPKENANEILDALVDLQVVLLGTVYLMGLYNTAPTIQVPGYEQNWPNQSMDVSIFEEAFNRVFQANIKKVPGMTKRGFSIDLMKPEGWKPPNHSDLVMGFFGYCKDCQCELKKPYGDNLKCDACAASDKPIDDTSSTYLPVAEGE